MMKKRYKWSADTIYHCIYFIQRMGNCLEFIFNSNAKSTKTQQQPSNQAPTTDRPLSHDKNDEGENEEAVNEEKKATSQEVSLNNSKGESITKHASTGIGLSECDRKASSVFSQLNTFESSSIIVKNPKEKFNEPNLNQEDFYTLIDKVFFVKKTMDKIKVLSPHNSSELNCPYKNILSTVYLSEGLPLESIKEISQGKIIQTTNSPLKITLKLQCKECEHRVKLTFAKSYIQVQEIMCDRCKNANKWALNDIDSNVPIWGDGRKIENNEILDLAPSRLRALGCIYCMKYADCQELPCLCFICKQCLEQNRTKQCHICEAAD